MSDIKKVGVIGCGLMGRGIAQVSAASTSESSRCRRQSVSCGHEPGRSSCRGDRVSVAMIPARADPASNTSDATAADSRY